MSTALIKNITAVITALRESKNLKDVTFNITRQLDFKGFNPSPVDQARRELIRAERDTVVATLKKDMWRELQNARQVGAGAVMDNVEGHLRKAYTASRELGFEAMGRTVGLDKFDLKTINDAAAQEAKHARKFVDDYVGDTGKMPYEKRMDMYGSAVQHQFNQAAVESTPARTKIWWMMSSAEPCDECPRLAAGSPYTDDFGDNPLPTVPQAGETPCLSNCKCYLYYAHTELYLGTEPDLSYEIDTIGGEEVNAEWLNSPVGRQMQQDLNTMYQRQAYHRQMMDMTSGDLNRYHLEQRNYWNGELKGYQQKFNLRAVPRANVNEYLAPLDNLRNGGYNLIRGQGPFAGEGALLRGMSVTQGHIDDIDDISVRLRLVTGQTKVLKYGDDSYTSLWGKADYCAIARENTVRRQLGRPLIVSLAQLEEAHPRKFQEWSQTSTWDGPTMKLKDTPSLKGATLTKDQLKGLPPGTIASGSHQAAGLQGWAQDTKTGLYLSPDDVAAYWMAQTGNCLGKPAKAALEKIKAPKGPAKTATIKPKPAVLDDLDKLVTENDKKVIKQNVEAAVRTLKSSTPLENAGDLFTLSNTDHKVLQKALNKTLDNTVTTAGTKASKFNQVVLRGWSDYSDPGLWSGSLLTHASGEQAIYSVTSGYGDLNKNLLAQITRNVQGTARSMLANHDLTEIELKRIVAVNREFSREVLRRVSKGNTIDVFRGVSREYGEAQGIAMNSKLVGQTHGILENPLSSWSVDRGQAESYMQHGGMLFKRTINIDDVFTTGFNSPSGAHLAEGELVVRTRGAVKVIVESVEV